MNDLNMKVPLEILTKTFTVYAGKAKTNTERGIVFELTQTIGSAIKQYNPNFNETQFVTDCGVKQDWAQLVA